MAGYDPYNDDDACFDVDNTKGPGASLPSNPSPSQLQSHDITMERQRQANVLYLSLLCQSLGVVTEVTNPIMGTEVGDDYVSIFKNVTNNPVRVQVFADLVTPGCGAILSLDPNKGDQGKFDALALVANGRTESVSVIVLPTLSIWARNFAFIAFPMVAVDTLRVRVFDPMKLLSYAHLYPQGH